MAFKQTCSTLKKVGDDEPIFVLRAQDESASMAVAYWLRMNPQLSVERKAEAERCIEAMVQWSHRKKAD
jgi:hypothetical protein